MDEKTKPPSSPRASPTALHEEKIEEGGIELHIQEISPSPKPEEALLGQGENQASPMTPDSKPFSPRKSTYSGYTIDEEKVEAQQSLTTTSKSLRLLKRQHILDLAQRITSLILSIIILAVMTHAYLTFLANKDVTAGGQAIYPSFMQLWPTYIMITAGAITVLLNTCIVFWRAHGTIKDLKREEMYNKMWDYALHGINFVVWLASSTSFGVSKNWGPATDPNVLWGYTCSPTAKGLNEMYPEIVKFYIQCEIQTVSFWMSVSAVTVEGFAVATKVFIR